MANEETTELSMEDRVESMFAGDVEDDTSNVVEPEHESDQEPELEVAEDEAEDEEKPEEQEEDTPELIDVEYDGKLYAVPPELKDALLRTQDYTQKTQETAAKRKEAEVVYGQALQSLENFKFAESIQGDVLKAQQLDGQAEQAKQYLRDNIDNPDLTSRDVDKIKLAIEDAENERNGIVQSINGKRQAQQQAQQQSQQELLKKGTEVLRQNIPSWGDEAQAQVKEHILAKGFTDAEVATLMDPRMVEIAWEAAQYRALQDGKAAAVKKVVATPTIKAQSRNPMPDDVKAKLNLRKQLKNPKLSSKAKARKIQDAMGDRFG